MKNKIALIFVLTFLLTSKIFSGGMHERYFVISPGIKYTYVFGGEGGSVFGLELAVSYLDSKNIINFGGVLAIDFNKKLQKIHLGLEVLFPIVSVEFGPTFLTDKVNNEFHLGYTVSPFLTGIMIYPVFSYSNFPRYKSIYELGVIFKYPFIQKDDNPVWLHALD